MQKYCRKMKKRRVNFSLLRANEMGNTKALLSILWASVVKICTFRCRPLACVRVSTGRWTCFHWPVETRTLPYGQQLASKIDWLFGCDLLFLIGGDASSLGGDASSRLLIK